MTSDRNQDSLAWSLDYAAQQLAGAFALAAPCGVLGPYILRGAWRAACRELHYLEMMVRRLLVFLAGQIAVDTLQPRPAPQASGPSPDRPPAPGAPRAASFPLNERVASLAQIQARYGGAAPALPRSVFGAGPDPGPVVNAARLAARFAALARVLERPERYARRYARRLWCAGGRLGKLALKLAHGLRPALARGGPLDLATSAYIEAERLCFCVLNRPP